MATIHEPHSPDVTDRRTFLRGAIGLPSAIVQSAAMVAPTAGIVATVAFIASYAGVASPLSFAIGTAICVCIAVVIGEYAKRIPTAGSFYAFLRATFGASAGFVAGMILALAYFIVLGFQLGFFGNFVQGLTAADGWSVTWQIFAGALMMLGVGLTVFGLRPSLRLGLIGLALEFVVLFALGVLIIVKGGASGNTLQPFNPANSLKGQSGLWIAVVYTIFSFTGFESAATLGEEAKRPRWTIPVAVIGAIVLIGLFEVFMSYATVIGYGTSKAGIVGLTGSSSPISSLAGRYGDPFLGFLIDLAIVSSFTALNIVTVSALSRMTYSMARDGLLPKGLGQLNRHKAPGRAAVALGVAALVYVLAVGTAWGSLNLASWVSYFATLFWIIAYACVILGLVVFIRRKYRSEWSWWLHGLIPLIAFGGVVWVARGNVHPLPPSPLRYFIWATIAITLGLCALGYWLKRRRPDIVNRAAYVFDEEPGEPQTAPAVGAGGPGYSGPPEGSPS